MSLWTAPHIVTLLSYRQQERVVDRLIFNEDAVRVDYLFRDNVAELSNCFGVNQVVKPNLV